MRSLLAALAASDANKSLVHFCAQESKTSARNLDQAVVKALRDAMRVTPHLVPENVEAVLAWIRAHPDDALVHASELARLWAWLLAFEQEQATESMKHGLSCLTSVAKPKPSNNEGGREENDKPSFAPLPSKETLAGMTDYVLGLVGEHKGDEVPGWGTPWNHLPASAEVPGLNVDLLWRSWREHTSNYIRGLETGFDTYERHYNKYTEHHLKARDRAHAEECLTQIARVSLVSPAMCAQETQLLQDVCNWFSAHATRAADDKQADPSYIAQAISGLETLITNALPPSLLVSLLSSLDTQLATLGLQRASLGTRCGLAPADAPLSSSPLLPGPPGSRP